MTLDDISKKLRGFRQQMAEDHLEASDNVRWWMVLFGAFLAGAAQFVQLPENLMPWVRAAGVFGAMLALLGGYWVHRADRHAAKAIVTAENAVDLARTEQATMDGRLRELGIATGALVDSHEHVRQLMAASIILREGVERAIEALPSKNISELVSLMLKGCLRPLLASLRFEAGERWTLTIYQERGGQLCGVQAFTVDREEQERPARIWPVGQGFAGAAFARDREIVLAEAQTQQVLSVLNVPETLARREDAAHYRSIAAVPVRVGGYDLPWGVVIATSDKVGRFDIGDDTEAAISAQTVRIIAGMVAVLVAAARKCDAVQISSPGADTN